MGVQSSPAIDELIDLAANAQAMWRTDVSAPQPAARKIPVPRRRTMSEARDATMRVVRSIDWRRVTTQQRLCIVGLAMIALALGLALRGGGSPGVSSAAAATPATTTRVSTITVTPIEEPASSPTVTPIDVGSEIEMPAMAVAQPKSQSKAAKKAKRTKTKKAKKRFRGMSSADEDWSE